MVGHRPWETRGEVESPDTKGNRDEVQETDVVGTAPKREEHVGR